MNTKIVLLTLGCSTLEAPHDHCLAPLPLPSPHHLQTSLSLH